MAKREDKSAFNTLADRYDRWYETAQGAAAFREEIACLRTVCPRFRGRWLEVGVGTGRFAAELGIAEGLDPSTTMLRHAAGRGVRVFEGRAEEIPFPDDTFDGILLALSLCFVRDADAALSECARVLRPSGTLLLGIVPAMSPWGGFYARKAAEGHPIYSLAMFRTLAETTAFAEKRGFGLCASASGLLWSPDGLPDAEPCVEPCGKESAGFAALRFKH